MTKNGKSQEKSLREKTEYPAFNKGLNLSSRKDYIETDYIDGVRDEEGKLVIRGLTDKEKEWLNTFYEETIITNFTHDPELKRLNRKKKAIIMDDTVKSLQLEVKKLEENKSKNGKRIRELKQIIRLTKKQNAEIYADQLEEIEEELQELRDELLLFPDKEDHKQFYNANNARNNCIFNRSRMMNKLLTLDAEDYDSFMATKYKNIDTEEALIYSLEREQYEELEDHLTEVLEDIKEHFRKKKTKT